MSEAATRGRRKLAKVGTPLGLLSTLYSTVHGSTTTERPDKVHFPLKSSLWLPGRLDLRGEVSKQGGW